MLITALFRGMLAHRLRLALTGLAIALGVAFMAGSFVFSATLTSSLDSLFVQANQGTDVQVSHTTPGGSTITGSPARPVPAGLLGVIRNVSGVRAADGEVTGQAVLLGRDGRPLPGTSFGVALSWPSGAPFQQTFTGRDGKPPVAANQVMIDRGSARRGHFAIGETIGIAIVGRAVPFTISGITGYGNADSIGGGAMAIFSVPEAQRLFGKDGVYDRIVVQAVPGVPAAVLADRIQRMLPAGDQAVTARDAAASAAQQLNSQLGILRDFFLGFAGIALFVGAFVIWNTFSILVGQRTRELALTRALGASTGQVFRTVVAQAALTAAAASACGVAAGLGLAKGLAALLKTFGLDLPGAGLSVPWSGLLLAAGAGIAVTVVAALAPAHRATRIAPVQAMRDPAPEPTVFGTRRLIAGALIATAGLGALVAGIASGSGPLAAAVGAIAVFIGVTVLAPLTVRPLAYLAGAPLTRLPGQAGLLARGNAIRNPKRTSATAAALMIGLAVISAMSVLVASARQTIGQQITTASHTSFYVEATTQSAGIAPALARTLAGVPGVAGVTEVRQVNATVDGAANRNVDGVDPVAISRFTDLGMTSGSLAALTAPGTVLTETGTGHHVGDTIVVQFGAYGTSPLRVAGTFANVGPLSGYLVSNATLASDSGVTADTVDLVRAPSSARPGLASALAGYPGAALKDQAGYIASQTAVLNTLLTLVTAMLVLSIVIALLGVVNTLALSIAERTREIGLLRALGMRPGQIRQMVAAESLIISAIGALLGAFLGIGLGAAISTALTHDHLALPVAQLIAYILATGAAGVLASLAPARRAARLNPLTALSAEPAGASG